MIAKSRSRANSIVKPSISESLQSGTRSRANSAEPCPLTGEKRRSRKNSRVTPKTRSRANSKRKRPRSPSIRWGGKKRRNLKKYQISGSLYARLCKHNGRAHEVIHGESPRKPGIKRRASLPRKAATWKAGKPIVPRRDSVDLGSLSRAHLRPKTRNPEKISRESCVVAPKWTRSKANKSRSASTESTDSNVLSSKPSRSASTESTDSNDAEISVRPVTYYRTETPEPLYRTETPEYRMSISVTPEPTPEPESDTEESLVFEDLEEAVVEPEPLALESVEKSVDYFNERNRAESELSVLFTETQLDSEKGPLEEVSADFTVEVRKPALSVTKNTAQLDEPQPEIIELEETFDALSQAKDTLSIRNSATTLDEPVKELEEPVQLERTSDDLTVQTRKHALSVHNSATQLEEPEEIVEAPVQLEETTNDLLVTVDDEEVALVAQGSQTQLSDVSEPEEEPVPEELQSTVVSQVFVAAPETLQIQNNETQLEDLTPEPELIVLEEELNGLDIEEEYDWSYLWWYAGGIATYWLLKGKPTEKHTYHTRTHKFQWD